MINILHLRDTDRICGPGKTIIETALAATPGAFCHKIGLFLLDRETRNVYHEAAAARGIEVVPLRTAHQFDPRMLWQIVKAIRQHDIHLIHAHDYKSELLTWAVTRVYRVPMITTVHGWIWNHMRYKMYWKAAQSVLPRFDRVIAVSGQTREKVLACGVPSEKVALIHNAIVTANYDPATVPRGTIRSRANIPPDARVVGYVGRLSPEKGQRDMLHAAAEVLRTHPDTWFVFAGDGPDRAAVEQLARDLNVAHRVVMLGHLADVRPVFRDSDIFALTSHTEGFPNVVLESLCMGTPVIATDVGGVREIVFDNETGLLLPAHQPPRIAAALRHLLDHPAEGARMLEAGRALVAKQFTFRQRVLNEEALCRDVLAAYAAV